MQFPPISLCSLSFGLFLSLMFSFLPFVLFHYSSFTIPVFSIFLPFPCSFLSHFFLSLSVGATSGSFQLQNRPAWLRERERDNRANPSVIPEAIALLYNPLIPLIPSHSAVSLAVRHIGILITREELQALCVCMRVLVSVSQLLLFNQCVSQTDLTQALRNSGKWINKPSPC